MCGPGLDLRFGQGEGVASYKVILKQSVKFEFRQWVSLHSGVAGASLPYKASGTLSIIASGLQLKSI